MATRMTYETGLLTLIKERWRRRHTASTKYAGRRLLTTHTLQKMGPLDTEVSCRLSLSSVPSIASFVPRCLSYGSRDVRSVVYVVDCAVNTILGLLLVHELTGRGLVYSCRKDSKS